MVVAIGAQERYSFNQNLLRFVDASFPATFDTNPITINPYADIAVIRIDRELPEPQGDGPHVYHSICLPNVDKLSAPIKLELAGWGFFAENTPSRFLLKAEWDYDGGSECAHIYSEKYKIPFTSSAAYCKIDYLLNGPIPGKVSM